GHHTRTRHTAPETHELIIRIQYGGGSRREARYGLALCAGHSLETAEAFEMLRAGVGDEADRRARHLDQLGHLARPVGAHLDDREAVARLEPQQRQRHADVVVEIAPRSETASGLRE